MISLATATPSAFWFLTRGTGAIALVLLTLSLALGVANVGRVRSVRVPRFVVDAVHRNASLLAVVFLGVHVATSLLDGFAPISLLDVVVPFGSAYRPVWLGLGALAFDLLIAVALTSLLRRRLGYDKWRAIHWLAYACWPVALLHGLGTGSDTKAHWMLLLTAGCVAVMLVAVLARAGFGWPQHRRASTAGIAASALGAGALLVWLPSGPLAAGWAQRAGTPSSLLPKTAPAATRAATTLSARSAAVAGQASFRAGVSGTVHRAHVDDDLSEIHLALSVSGQRLSALGVRMYGHPLEGGGVQLTSSRAELGTAANPRMYLGQVTGLAGAQIAAVLAGPGRSRLVLDARVQIEPGTDRARGSVTVRSAGA